MSKKVLTTPIKDEDLKDIRVGDIIYLTGTLVTCRDVAHRRLIEETGVKVIVGKGGMGKNTEEGCKTHKALHVVFAAGNAVYAAVKVERIKEVHWKDLGMPESLWVCEVNYCFY